MYQPVPGAVPGAAVLTVAGAVAAGAAVTWLVEAATGAANVVGRNRC